MDYFISIVGLKPILPLFNGFIPNILKSKDWKQQYGVFMSLGTIVGAKYDAELDILQLVLSFILPYIETGIFFVTFQ